MNAYRVKAWCGYHVISVDMDQNHPEKVLGEGTVHIFDADFQF